MEMLPDDVLLMVLEELYEEADIFACRLVCKRLAALALHPAVWRNFYLSCFETHCVCPVLRLAPCLADMYIKLPANGCHQWAFASTRCAVKSLWIFVDGSSNAAHAAAIICKQEINGRLTDVHIEIRSEAVAEVTMLLGMLASTSRLEMLRVEAYLPEHLLSTTTAPMVTAAVASSLRDFTCRLSAFTEPFVNFILSEHAATLEVVDLDPSPSSWMFTSTAPLLVGATNLSKLTCCCLPGMEALTACKSLKVLELTVHTESLNRPVVAGVATLLRGAEHLREVSLQYEPAVRSVTDVGAELVLALASGRSRVETLIIQNYVSGCGENSPLHQPVVSALPSLPALRRLKLAENLDNPDQILLAISPDVAPALQKVEVNLGEGCAHSWIHGDTVKSVFTLNPTLHVHVSSSKIGCSDGAHCQACKLDCHAKLRAVGWFYHWLFSHDPADQCSVEHPVGSEHWIHLPL
ncbi:uncharacterized protein LOC113206215 isoform X3 [Frankliniella occidentalis]|uniref:Uncharacterized protein LOC113206215 isoform X3 n=1 Tax=Frankliniella occidentalis TaxID=133901 RepID=A0A9C6WSZ2_FRAOC|nr:uncharacterized protein LOC113206215 isoform X3 [Frankliniella occidentalis]